MSTKVIGDLGETLASVFLERKGYRILERNYRRAWGEVDIIAEKSGSIRFVEVKSVSRENWNQPDGEFSRETDYRPEEQVHPEKLRKIGRMAETYMAERHDAREYQIDVVGVFLDHARRHARCRLFENATL